MKKILLILFTFLSIVCFSQKKEHDTIIYFNGLRVLNHVAYPPTPGAGELWMKDDTLRQYTGTVWLSWGKSYAGSETDPVFIADSNLFPKKTYLSALNAHNIKYTDTTAWKNNKATTDYRRYKDSLVLSTATNLKLAKADTASLSNRINKKINYTDTVGWKNNKATTDYRRYKDSLVLSTATNLKLAKTDTASLSNRINKKINYTDTVGWKNNKATTDYRRYRDSVVLANAIIGSVAKTSYGCICMTSDVASCSIPSYGTYAHWYAGSLSAAEPAVNISRSTTKNAFIITTGYEGVYHVHFDVSVTGAGAGDLKVYVNNSATLVVGQYLATTTGSNLCMGDGYIVVAAGDSVKIYNSGSTTASTGYCYHFSIERKSN